MSYHYEEIPDLSTTRSCVVCLAPATKLRFKFAQTHEVNRSSKQFVCANHEKED